MAFLGEAAGDAVARLQAVAPRVLSFDDLDGWGEDDHAASLTAFAVMASEAPFLKAALAALPESGDAERARRFFEETFLPVVVDGSDQALFTGYYEPELDGSLHRSDRFGVPLYKAPPDLPENGQWASRTDIEAQGLLSDRGLELAWIEHPIDRFLLQVQGSGRIKLAEGGCLRLGYGGRNGHPYRSIGQDLIRRGVIAEEDMSAARLRDYVLACPDGGQSLMAHNPSYVFFRALPSDRPDLGPIGTMGHPVTAMRTIAVDPQHIPLGFPVWIETRGANRMRRLMIAQDTGSAIKGPGRADVFVGTGDAAGARAGRMRDRGRMVLLLPRTLLGPSESGATSRALGDAAP